MVTKVCQWSWKEKVSSKRESDEYERDYFWQNLQSCKRLLKRDSLFSKLSSLAKPMHKNTIQL